jgi:hypothetical protein
VQLVLKRGVSAKFIVEEEIYLFSLKYKYCIVERRDGDITLPDEGCLTTVNRILLCYPICMIQKILGA